MKLFKLATVHVLCLLPMYSDGMQHTAKPNGILRRRPTPYVSVPMLHDRLNQVSALAAQLAEQNRVSGIEIQQKNQIIGLQQALISAYELQNNENAMRSEDQESIIRDLKIRLAHLQSPKMMP